MVVFMSVSVVPRKDHSHFCIFQVLHIWKHDRKHKVLHWDVFLSQFVPWAGWAHWPNTFQLCSLYYIRHWNCSIREIPLYGSFINLIDRDVGNMIIFITRLWHSKESSHFRLRKKNRQLFFPALLLNLHECFFDSSWRWGKCLSGLENAARKWEAE